MYLPKYQEPIKENLEISIAKLSPHLLLVLKRIFPGNDFWQTSHVLLLSKELGGFEEVDFQRRVGASFNPRPARIGLILMNEAGVRELSIVTSGILSTVAEKIVPPLDQYGISADIITLAKESTKNAKDFLAKHCENYHNIILIVLALWLDRARHIHLINESSRKDIWPGFLDQSKDYIQLASLYAPRFLPFLESWHSRFQSLCQHR